MAQQRLTESEEPLRYYCDSIRHLVCLPYTIPNLHRMARELKIHRCWFHSSSKHPHYDLPKKRIAEITAKCRLVAGRDILAIMQGTYTGP